MKKYLYVMKTTINDSMQYISSLLFRFVGFAILIAVLVSLWDFLYSEPGTTINGYTFNQMMGYLIVAIITYITSKYVVIKYEMIGASVLYMISMFILLIIYVFLFVISGREYFNKEVKEKVK